MYLLEDLAFRANEMTPRIEPFFDATTGTFSYVVHEEGGVACAIIDSVLGYDQRSGRTSAAGADQIADYVRQGGLQVQWHLETHVHADHISAAAYLRQSLGGKIAMSARIADVRQTFSHAFDLAPASLQATDFDHLFEDGERFLIGRLNAEVISVPGHTPADLAYRIGEQAVFVGDTLFMPDIGSARCDFPGGDAQLLFRSVRKLLALPPQTVLYMCHDYPPDGRAPVWHTTVQEQRERNIHLRDGVELADFVHMRTRRDATLSLPQLIIPALQVNMHAGELPAAGDNGIRYLKIPLNTF